MVISKPILFSMNATSRFLSSVEVMQKPHTGSTKKQDALFKQHVEPHIELLYRAARNMANNPADTQDLVQETLIKAYKAINRFDGQYPKAWLLTILRNTAITFFEKRKPELLTDNAAFLDTINRYNFDLKDPLENEFEVETLDAFNKLNPDMNRLIVLVDIEGMSYSEAATLEDIPAGTLMSRLHRARTLIKDHLERQGITSSKDMA